MGDVLCASCKEPWDTYGIYHEIMWEADWSPLTWAEEPPIEALTSKTLKEPKVREIMKALGWEFGPSPLAILHCPCCPKDAKPDPEREAVYNALADIMGEDDDGLASELEDYDM